MYINMSNGECLLLVLYLSECHSAFFSDETEEGEEANERAKQVD